MYHKNFTIAHVISIMYCWLLVNNTQKSYDAARASFTISEKDGFVPKPSSYQLRLFGAFSRHLSKGMQRIAVVLNQKDVLAVAFKGAKELSTLVLLNRSSVRTEVSIDGWAGKKCR